MITDDVITTINWGAKATVSSSDLTSAYSISYVREWLNQEFLSTLYNYENIIDTNAGWYSITDSAELPTKPTGDYTLTDPVGLLNSYEYYMSYQNVTTKTGYLGISYNWLLITPFNSDYISITSDSYIAVSDPDYNASGARPSINLKSTVEFDGGEGTVSNPYTIKGDIGEVSPNKTLLNTRMSGEYLKLENDETNQVFRIVDNEKVGNNLTTKIILNDYVKSNGSVISKKFAGAESHDLWTEVDKTNTTYWRGYLNNTWISEIDNTYNTGTGTSSILEKGTYYLGYYMIESYKATVCSSVSSDISVKECIENGNVVANKSSDDYVGLPRFGEMFACLKTSYANTYSMWLITSYYPTLSLVHFVNPYGSLYNDYPTIMNAARPTINLKSTIVIKSGNGTQTDPFVVGLP